MIDSFNVNFHSLSAKLFLLTFAGFIMTSEAPNCPHCGARLAKMSLPPESGYDCDFLYVCFADDCPYFIKGRDWMFEKYHARVSYRYRLNPLTGGDGPIGVWSPTALKDRIIRE